MTTNPRCATGSCAFLVKGVVAVGWPQGGATIAIKKRAPALDDRGGRREQRQSENELYQSSVCHVEAVSLAIGRFYFDSAIRGRPARCSAERRVLERSRVASSSARSSRKIRNIVAPGPELSWRRAGVLCVCLHVSLECSASGEHVVYLYTYPVRVLLRTSNVHASFATLLLLLCCYCRRRRHQRRRRCRCCFCTLSPTSRSTSPVVIIGRDQMRD